MLHRHPAQPLPQIVRRLLLCAALLPLLLPAEPGASGRVPDADFSADQFQAHVEYLAHPARQGRLLGSRGASDAAAYIEKQFRAFGLQSPPSGFRQRFPVRLDLSLAADSRQNRLRIASATGATALELHRDYLPLPFSPNANIANAPLVFAGYAMETVDPVYNDFDGLSLEGAIVIALRREPQESEEDSAFRGLDFLEQSAFAAKAEAVAARGGKALLIVSNRLPDEEQSDIPAFAKSAGPGTTPIPVLLIRPKALAPLFNEFGQPLEALVNTINRTASPQSFTFPAATRAELRVRIAGKSATGENVLGWLPGATDEYIVVGAHYDHIGLGERFSMDNAGSGKVHPGADDNASGVAAMLELARVSAGQPRRRGILFAAFGGEEHGLFGSSFLLRNTTLPGQRCAGMLNFDMVGRLREDELFLAGLESVQDANAVVSAAAERQGLRISPLSDYPYNMSDHGTFLAAGYPSLLFFTGLHMEYHTSRDTADRIDTPGSIRVLAVARSILEWMASSETGPTFVPGRNPGYQRKFKEMATPSNPYDNE